MKVLSRSIGPRLRWKARLEFNVQYLWIGVCWSRDGLWTDVWICLLPCIPIHVVVVSGEWEDPLEAQP